MFKKIQFILAKFNTIKTIEKKIIENKKRLNEIEYLHREEYTEPDDSFLMHEAIEIEKYNKILDLKRQYKLDRRNGWVSRIIWSILAPIIIAVIVSLINYHFD